VDLLSREVRLFQLANVRASAHACPATTICPVSLKTGRSISIAAAGAAAPATLATSDMSKGRLPTSVASAASGSKTSAITSAQKVIKCPGNRLLSTSAYDPSCLNIDSAETANGPDGGPGLVSANRPLKFRVCALRVRGVLPSNPPGARTLTSGFSTSGLVSSGLRSTITVQHALYSYAILSIRAPFLAAAWTGCTRNTAMSRLTTGTITRPAIGIESTTTIWHEFARASSIEALYTSHRGPKPNAVCKRFL
jgi:hypothetical protein